MTNSRNSDSMRMRQTVCTCATLYALTPKLYAHMQYCMPMSHTLCADSKLYAHAPYSKRTRDTDWCLCKTWFHTLIQTKKVAVMRMNWSTAKTSDAKYFMLHDETSKKIHHEMTLIVIWVDAFWDAYAWCVMRMRERCVCVMRVHARQSLCKGVLD